MSSFGLGSLLEEMAARPTAATPTPIASPPAAADMLESLWDRMGSETELTRRLAEQHRIVEELQKQKNHAEQRWAQALSPCCYALPHMLLAVAQQSLYRAA